MRKSLRSLPALYSLFFFFSVSSLSAQKVAISGFHSDTPDGFSFVCLDNLVSGEKIYFTDREYQAVLNKFNTGEAIVTYTVPVSGHATGTVIYISETSDDNLSATSGDGNSGTVSLIGSFELSNDGDQLYAFGASDPLDPNESITQIYSFVLFGGYASPTTIASLNPKEDPDCPCSADFTVMTPWWVDNGQFDFGPGDRNNIDLTDFNNYFNWNVNNVAIGALNTTAFTNLQFGGATFPVEWLSFEAEVRGPFIALEWATASELNNDYFAVERSIDGLAYLQVGTVQGAGTSQDIQAYSFTDLTPANGANYYRLRQVDYDGAFDFSDVVRVELTEAGNQVRLYPNPVVDYLNVESRAGTLRLFNLAGQQLLDMRIEAGITRVDLSGLKPGLYFAEILDEDQSRTTHRILK